MSRTVKPGQESLIHLLEAVRDGALDPREALDDLAVLPYTDLGFARVDGHRAIRGGFPEVIFGQGKRPEQVLEIAQTILGQSSRLLVTRCEPGAAALLTAEFEDAIHNDVARTVVVDRSGKQPLKHGITIACAGTADLPVAHEAVDTARIMGNAVETVFDVGVAGIHRLFSSMKSLRTANVLVVVAGMEGALPSVVGGLVSVPVIAVPTSVGYGASFSGVAALLAMLNSCAPNVTVCNIDNGFGAGYVASLINAGVVEDAQ